MKHQTPSQAQTEAVENDTEPEGEGITEAEAAEPLDIDLDEVSPKVEAALLTSDRAMTSGKIAEALGLNFPGGSKPVNEAIAKLNGEYEATGRAFRIEQVAGGWQVMTLPEFADVLAALHKTKAQSKLSPAAMETLAIVAYKQPVLRADLEAIRGVACGETLRSLMERHLVKIVGRAEEIGRPMLYGTTKQFLEIFGLASLKDLPKVEELRQGGVG
ncbi:MAG: SMC-Scp complex subunit ScpB [Planctomycetota bacterium]